MIEPPMENDALPNRPVVVRALSEVDFGLLLIWLNEPHLRPHYMRESISADQIERKFTPRLAEDHPCRSLIAELDGEPFGYTQWYLNASFPDYGAATIGETAGISLDYFIGNTAYLGSRLGSVMLNAAVVTAVCRVEVSDKILFVGHQTENKAAIRCSSRAGFHYRKDFVEEGRQCALFVRDERQASDND